MLFVIGAVYVLGPLLPIKQTWARLLIFSAVWLVVARYLDWRFFETVLPARGAWYEIGWIWLCFTVELLAVADQLLLYITFLRPTDRRGEADAHEARMRSLPPDELPSVDVFIPTYNEPIEVLEKTIIGALCLDYPNVNVWVLDDGRRPWLKAFCEAKGRGLSHATGQQSRQGRQHQPCARPHQRTIGGDFRRRFRAATQFSHAHHRLLHRSECRHRPVSPRLL